MSVVKYKVGSEEHSFSTDLQIANLLAVETFLIEEIKNNMRLNDVKGIMHDISIVDDNGIMAEAKDFKDTGKLIIKMIKS